ncbi:DUF3558 domain-containing protein [Nocardia otitidiscaviarum]|uniref:DUF3558 domain-containing protein n=1 Tax=Nocardia otitidiscaviarum TaxID=1823 RepID=A0A516NFE0_9NOCA|nr:DUF3558 family protein [Nocardia otitidiscaviarum]MCP9622939.1 DUF3558 family protein [Nocardia otitidiscaviarum]QDP77623.1 DUF3558 domain-containing protein [Nocardia otitidiscaviarum]
MYLVAGRFALSLLLFGACALAAGCSGWTDGDADHTTGFTLPPSCADIDGPVAEVLREYIGDLYRTDKRLQTLETKIDNMYRRVRCILVLEDPVPHGSSAPEAGPMSRTVEIGLMVDVPLPAITTTMRPAGGFGSRVDTTAPLPGVGDEALSWTGSGFLDRDVAGASAQVGNLRIDVEVVGMDWTGGDAVPVYSSRYMKADLRSGAESIVAALARELPATMPQTTFDRTLPPVSAVSTPLREPSAISVWDPCTIPDSAIAQVGLDPAAKATKVFSLLDDAKTCGWETDDYTFSVSAGANRFTSVFYYPGHYPSFQSITVGGRQAMSLPDAISEGNQCNLAFDAPQGERYAAAVGVVEMTVRSRDYDHRDRDALCTKLFRIADPLVQYLPPGR